MKKSYEDLNEEMLDLFVNKKWIIKELYQSINQHLTPDFSVEDWLTLHEKAIYGDLLSMQMLTALWKSKVYPYLKPEIKKIVQEDN